MLRRALVSVLAFLLIPAGLSARKSQGKPRVYCTGCERTSKGHIKRSRTAKSRFRATHPCPATGRTTGPCPGYVIDHIKPLKRGGPDAPENMQWQTTAEAKAKDKIE